MKRQLIILLLLCLGASSLRAQDTAAVRGVVPLRSDTIPSCRRRPVNDYPGLNSLMRRLANPGWNGLMKDIHTGLKLEGGRIRPLGGSLTEADAGISPVTSSGSYAGENAEAAGAPVTSSGSYAGENAEPLSLYMREMALGEVPVGPPVFVFFRLAGSYITDSAQMLNIQAAAELSVRENLLVRIDHRSGGLGYGLSGEERGAGPRQGRTRGEADERQGSPSGEDRGTVRGWDNHL